MLLDQETQLISAIGRHKLEADTENKDKRIQAFLNKVRIPPPPNKVLLIEYYLYKSEKNLQMKKTNKLFPWECLAFIILDWKSFCLEYINYKSSLCKLNDMYLISWNLLQAAAPKKWKGHDGKTTEMDTPYTIRAKELRDIYNSINMKYLTQDERLDVLLTLKHTVKV